MASKNTTAAGSRRERQVVEYYRERGWFAMRAPASLGVADVIAVSPRPGGGCEVHMVEVKARIGSVYVGFRRDDRADLLAAAEAAGATPLLCSWPPNGEMKFIPAEDWPPHE